MPAAGSFEKVGVQAVVEGFGRYMQDLGKMETKSKGFGSSLRGLGKTALAMGTGFIAAQASMAGVRTIMSKSIGAAVAYEAQMAEIRALTGATEQDTDLLTVAIKDMTRTMPKSPAELGAAAYFILSSGIEDAAEAADVLEVAARASTIGLGETEAVANALTTVLNAYGLEAGEAGHVTDVMIEAVKQGKAEASEFAGVLGRVVPLAAQMGISFEEVAANLATFTRLGVSADEAATGLRQVMASLLKPTEQQEEAMEELGFTAEGLRKQIKDKGLLATLSDMIEATGGNEAAVAKLFPNIRALTSVLGTAGVQMDDYTDILAATNDATGNLDEGFAIVSDTAKFKMGVAMNELNLMLMELGEEILPALVPAMKAVVAVAVLLTKAMTALVKPIIFIGDAFDTAFGKMPSDLEIVSKKLKGMAAAADITEDEFIDLAKAAGLTLDEAKKLAADTAFPTQMEVWIEKAQRFGMSAEEAEAAWNEASSGLVEDFTTVDRAVRDSEEIQRNLAATVKDEVGPTMLGTLADIAGAADGVRSAMSNMFQTTTAEEADAELALANLKLEAGRLENKVDDLTAAESERLAVLKDELIPTQQADLDLLRLERDAVLKHAEAMDAANPHMEVWRMGIAEATRLVGGLDGALRGIPTQIQTRIEITSAGFQFNLKDWLKENFPAIYGAQHGFHGDVSRPTMFLAGEAGRERVDISPQPSTVREMVLAPQPAATPGLDRLAQALEGRGGGDMSVSVSAPSQEQIAEEVASAMRGLAFELGRASA